MNSTLLFISFHFDSQRKKAEEKMGAGTATAEMKGSEIEVEGLACTYISTNRRTDIKTGK